ncbi:MAG: hypothetical protein OXC95_15335 [Dehalococcoidia bacterium]|nr:hypothetical protein [Dehalococcoidia bacterium]
MAYSKASDDSSVALTVVAYVPKRLDRGVETPGPETHQLQVDHSQVVLDNATNLGNVQRRQFGPDILRFIEPEQPDGE